MELSEKAKHLDIGFRLFKVDTSNMKDVYYTPDELKQDNLELFKDHIKPNRSSYDLLFQVFIGWGLDLTLPIAQESIDGKNVFSVNTNALIACFDTGINEELVKKLAAHKPLRAVFRDDAFGSGSMLSRFSGCCRREQRLRPCRGDRPVALAGNADNV